MKDFHDELIIINEAIDKKVQEISVANKELEELKYKHYITLQERNKHEALKELRNFIDIHGNILDKKLHNELRHKLIVIMYKELYARSYDLVLRLILNNLEVQHEYLSKKGEPIQLQIMLK